MDSEQRALQFGTQFEVAPKDKRGEPDSTDTPSGSGEHPYTARERDETAATAEAEPSDTPSPTQSAVGMTEPFGGSLADVKRLEASLRWLRQQSAELRKLHLHPPILSLAPAARQTGGSADGSAAHSLDAENFVPPALVRARRAKMERPLASMSTPLLILLAGLLVAPIVYFFAGKSPSAPEREAKLVAVDLHGGAPPALALPTQTVANTVGVAVPPSWSEASKMPIQPSVATLSPADSQLLMNWGQEFMVIGDLAAARIAFRRAAQAGDAAAALAMGSTYDPLVLQRIGALGVTPDPELARTWYERARDFGSAEAPGRIKMLADH